MPARFDVFGPRALSIVLPQRLGLRFGDIVVDWRCGYGQLVKNFLSNGYDTIGFDDRPEVLHEALPEIQHRVYLSRIMQIVYPRQVDLMTALDVFSHMTDNQIDQLLTFVSGRTKWIFLHTTVAGALTTDTQHINLKTPDQWVDVLQKYRYKYVPYELEPYYTNRPGTFSALFEKESV
jgi:hypothetical protein